MWKVYTKTGDSGLTSTAKNTRIPKDSILIELQGGIDEINASIGYLRSLIYPKNNFHSIDKELKEIQHTIFLLGSEVSFNLEKTFVNSEHISFLENRIDFMTNISPELNSFIYCSGTTESTYSHVIRTIIRRVERCFVTVLRELNQNTYPHSYMYVNRLSDYFFALGRYINSIDGFLEEPLTI
ncbi:cob(I)yrinic acid a,c-diamide adenosyltransferase [Clostridium cylindrosporum]|uniref:Corrinoid adenosyltransferase n=1 Tax=Clostridium cylindrosporum DSM 605 TaxID=1121307 RepID=A0A0J8D984_CLOCY|nr:cob(I)yrinic acid a,c-diamide adenosyltransferase [Clostridium cylindrosporum]KMT20843.1 Cob(I)yrinic acid a,c-diamide adenosyltransferase [Clostridium cylindrosporum DSM 605]